MTAARVIAASAPTSRVSTTMPAITGKQAALANQAPQRGREQAGDDGDIKARDDDDVAGAGAVELVVEVGVDAGFDAEQDTGQQGGFRLGQQSGDHRLSLGTDGVERSPERVALAAAEQGHLGPLDHRVHALACQVLLVVIGTMSKWNPPVL